MEGLSALGWVSVENQSPIIKGINDDPDALRIMQRSLKRVGAENHYFFCGRDIVAHEAFNVPIETAWHILERVPEGAVRRGDARPTLDHPLQGQDRGRRGHQRADSRVPGTENGVVIFKILRNAASAPDRGKVCIVGRNPEAIWFDGYADRVIYDEAGLFDYARVKAASAAPRRLGPVPPASPSVA